MTDNMAKNICKWASIVLVALSLIAFMGGGIKIADKKGFKEFKKELSKKLSYIGIYSLDDLDEDDTDEEYLENIQELFDMSDIDLEAEDAVKIITKSLKAVDDGKISMKEYAAIAPKYKKMVGAVLEAYMEDVDDEDIEEAEDSIRKFRSYTTFPVVMFYITILCGLVVIFLHFVNHKLPGISLTMINLIWVIALIVATNKLNIEMEDELEMDPGFFKMASGSVWAFIFALLAMLIWMFRETIAAKLSNAALPVPTMKPAAGSIIPNAGAQTANVIRCSNCGNALNPGAVFCPMCGSKYEPPAEPSDPVKSSQPEIQPQIQAPKNCPGCGAVLDDDAVFCGMCGYKLD